MSEFGKIEFHRVGEEWTAVYLDGTLQRVGDSYLADEWLQEHAGVKVVPDSPCMIDDHKAFRTLAEVEAEAERRASLAAQAQALRLQAAELMGRAQELDKEAIG